MILNHRLISIEWEGITSLSVCHLVRIPCLVGDQCNVTIVDFLPLQKEPLRFHLDTTILAPHLVDLVLEIQRIAESTLFHWKTFPLNLPHPIAVQEFSEGSASTRRKPLIVENLFDIPSWDDLDVVSVDAHGEAKHLSNKQLTSVRQNG